MLRCRASRLAALPASGFGIALLFAPSAAIAQSVPDIQDLVTQGEVLNRSATLATEGTRADRAADKSIIDGEGGLYVLRLNEIFQVAVSGAVGYTDNPTRTSNNTGGSAFIDGAVSAGIATRVAEAVDMGVNLNVGGREFLTDRGPSSRSVSANAFVGTNLIGPVYASIVGFGGYSFDNAFKYGSSFYGVSGNLSAALPLSKRILVRPGAGVTRQWSETSENNSTSINASVDAMAALMPKLMLSARASAGIRWYDNFYEDVMFVSRRDEIYAGSAALAWQTTDNMAISLSVTYEKQDSTFFVSDFSAFETIGAISMHWRF